MVPGPFILGAIDQGSDDPKPGFSAAKVLGGSQDRIAREGLDGAILGAGLPRGNRLDHPDGEAAGSPPGDLGRTENRGSGSRGRVAVPTRELGRSADSPGVEQVFRATAVPPVAVHMKRKEARAFHEERPPLLEKRLEGGEVEHRGIGFDLAEIRIYPYIHPALTRQ